MSLLRGLRAIDPAEAELRRVVIAALTGVAVDGGMAVATAPAARDPRGGWLCCVNAVAFALDRIDHSAVRFDADDALAAASLIERAEPAIAAIEAALGIALEPERLADAPPPGAIFVVETPATRVRLCLPVDLALMPPPPSFAPAAIAGIAVAATLTIAGPRVAPLDAAALAAGDLVLLGAGPLPARLHVAGASLSGRFDPAAASMRIHSFGAP